MMRTMLRNTILTLLSVLLCQVFLQAEEASISPRVQVEIDKIKEWGKDSILVKEVESQNQKNLSMEEIEKREREWAAESGVNELVEQLLTNACAERLKALVHEDPAYPEVFVMDNKGALVGMTRKTSDYWQGDEDKWSRAFLEGKGATFVDKRQYDTSAKSTLQQISVPVMRDATAIGVITVGLNLSKLVHE